MFTSPALAKRMAARLADHPVWQAATPKDVTDVLAVSGMIEGAERGRMIRTLSDLNRAPVPTLEVVAVAAFEAIGGSLAYAALHHWSIDCDEPSCPIPLPDVSAAKPWSIAERVAVTAGVGPVRAAITLLNHLVYGQSIGHHGPDAYLPGIMQSLASAIASHSKTLRVPGLDMGLAASVLRAKNAAPDPLLRWVEHLGSVTVFDQSALARADVLDMARAHDRPQTDADDLVDRYWSSLGSRLADRNPNAARLDRPTDNTQAAAVIIDLVAKAAAGTLDDVDRWVELAETDPASVDFAELYALAAKDEQTAPHVLAVATAKFGEPRNLQSWATGTPELDRLMLAEAGRVLTERFRHIASTLTEALRDDSPDTAAHVETLVSTIADPTDADDPTSALTTLAELATTYADQLGALLDHDEEAVAAGLIIDGAYDRTTALWSAWVALLAEAVSLRMLADDDTSPGSLLDQVRDATVAVAATGRRLIDALVALAEQLDIDDDGSISGVRDAILAQHHGAVDPDALWERAVSDAAVADEKALTSAARRIHRQARRSDGGVRERLRTIAELDPNATVEDMLATVEDMPTRDLRLLAAAAATGRYSITIESGQSPLEPHLSRWDDLQTAVAELAAADDEDTSDDDTPVVQVNEDDDDTTDAPAEEDTGDDRDLLADAYVNAIAEGRYDFAAVYADLDSDVGCRADVARTAALAAHDVSPRSPAVAELSNWLSDADLDEVVGASDDCARLLTASALSLAVSAPFATLPLLNWAAHRNSHAQPYLADVLTAVTNGRYGPGTLKTVTPSTRVAAASREAADLAATAKDALETAQARKLTYSGATDVFRAWLDPDNDEGWLGRMLTTVADNDTAKHADVASQVSEWTDRSIDRQIDATDRAISGEAALVTRDYGRIEATARTQLRRRAADLVGIAQRWADAAGRVTPSDDDTVASNVRDNWGQLVAALAPTTTGFDAGIRRLLDRAHQLLTGTRMIDSTAESMTWPAATVGRLLRITGVPLGWDGDKVMVDYTKADPDRIIELEATANPGPWEHALRMHRHDSDLAATLIEVAGVLAGEDVEETLLSAWVS